MKIFISQSGERSKELALALQEFVRLVILEADPWVSKNGIDKGTRSLAKIGESLESAVAGIICLTSENLGAPWILFEAGALSKRQTDHVWTVLLDVDNTQVEPPLGQFQHTAASKDDLWSVMESINQVSPKPRTNADLKKMFEAFWPEVGKTIERLKTQVPSTKVEARDQAAISAEILGITRGLQNQIELSLTRGEKVMRLLGLLYRMTQHDNPPSLKELREIDHTLKERTLDFGKEDSEGTLVIYDHFSQAKTLRDMLRIAAELGEKRRDARIKARKGSDGSLKSPEPKKRNNK